MALVQSRTVSMAALLAILACPQAAVSADEGPPVGVLGRPDRLVVRGLDTLDPERLRRPLVGDYEVRWMSRPEAPRGPLLEALAHKSRQALAGVGHAAAQVTSRVETIDGGERIVLDVAAGPVYETGPIEVRGLDEALTAGLVKALREPQRDPSAVPEFVDLPDGGTTVRWRDANGHVASITPPLWPEARPARCDDALLDCARDLVARFLAEEGYVSIAPPVTRGTGGHAVRSWNRTDAGIDAAFDFSDGRTAKLVVTVARLPPEARLARIEVSTGATTTPEELAAFLGIELGARVSQRDRIEWLGKLRGSARYLRHGVDFEPDVLDPACVVARFDLDEYAPMMPLSRPLSREEETMLRGRHWLLHALADDRDLVFDMAGREAGPDSAAVLPCRVGVSAKNGLAVLQRLDLGNLQGAVVTQHHFRVMAPGGAGWFDWPVARTSRCRCVIAAHFVRMRRDIVPEWDTEGIHLQWGLKYDFEAPKDRPAGIDFGLRIDPVTAVVFLHHRQPPTRWEGDVLVVDRQRGSPLRIDGLTGRVLSIDICDGIIVEQRAGALAALDDLAASAGTARNDADRPFTALLRFLVVDHGLDSLSTTAIAALGLDREQQEAWRRIGAVLERVVQRCDEDDAFAAIDRLVAARLVEPAASAGTDDLTVPHLGLAGPGMPTDLLSSGFALAWGWSERHVGSDTWSTAAARLMTVGRAGGPGYRDELTGFLADDRFGPLAYLTTAVCAARGDTAALLARRGLARCTVEAFRADCAPLVGTRSALDLDRIVSSVLRGLDDESIASLGESIASDRDLLVPLVHTLRSSPAPAGGGLQGSLDAWWEGGLGDVVSRLLRRIAGTARPEVAVQPARAEEPMPRIPVPTGKPLFDVELFDLSPK